MRRILFSGVALAVLAISVVAPAHAKRNQPVLTPPTAPKSCAAISQCYTGGYNGLSGVNYGAQVQARTTLRR